MLALKALLLLAMVSTAIAYSMTMELPGNSRSVTINGNYCYVCGGSAGVTIIDLTAAGGPQIVGNYTQKYANRIIIRGQRAYLGAGADGFVLLDATDPTKLIFLKQWVLSNAFVTEVDSADGLAYVADFNHGLYVLEIVELPGQPIKFAQQFSDTFLTSLNGVKGNGTRFCVASSALIGSPVYDTSSRSVVLIGYAGSSKEVAYDTSGNMLMIESTWNSFEIYTAGTTDTKPKRLYTTSYGTPVSVDVKGTVAYVATKTAGLCYYTIRTPSSTSRLSCVAMPVNTTAAGVSVSQTSDTIAVALGTSGVRFLGLAGEGPATVEPTTSPTAAPTLAPTVPAATPSPGESTPSPNDVISPTVTIALTPPPTGVPTTVPTTLAPGGDSTLSPGGDSTLSPGGDSTLSPGGGGTSSPGGDSTLSPGGGGTSSPSTSVPDSDSDNARLWLLIYLLVGLLLLIVIGILIYCCVKRDPTPKGNEQLLDLEDVVPEASSYNQLQQIQSADAAPLS